MISLLIKSYFTTLVSIAAASTFIFLSGLMLIVRFFTSSRTLKKYQETFVIDINPHDGSVDDVSAIAGENVLATQLDLARAYIETGKKILAKNILEYVIEQGNLAQKNEARHLLNCISSLS